MCRRSRTSSGEYDMWIQDKGAEGDSNEQPHMVQVCKAKTTPYDHSWYPYKMTQTFEWKVNGGTLTS